MRFSPRLIVIVRRLLLGGACLGTAFALFIAIENWRGDRAWAAVEGDLRARGERLDFAAFQPPPVPDEQNFFQTARLGRLLYDRPEDPERQRLLTDVRSPTVSLLQQFRGKYPDLASLRDALRRRGLAEGPSGETPAAGILRALQPLQPLLDELRNAAPARTHAVLESRVLHAGPPQVDAETVFGIGQVLSVRAVAEIELDRSEDAFADLFALQRLAHGLADRPANLLLLLVAVALQDRAIDAIADGVRRRAWTDAQLAQFQALLDRMQPLAGLGTALRAERAEIMHLLDTRPVITTSEFRWPVWMFHGWAQQNKVSYCRRLDAEILSRFTPDRIVRPPASAPLPTVTSSPGLLAPYQFVSAMALKDMDRIVEGLGADVDRQKLHAVSWAVERHRLVRGRFPDALEAIVPAFLPSLPRSVLHGELPRYQLLADEGYRLHFLGRNGRDDDGKDDDTAVTRPGGP